MTVTTIDLQLYPCLCNFTPVYATLPLFMQLYPCFRTNLTKQPQQQFDLIQSVVSVHCYFSLHVTSDRLLNSSLPRAVRYKKHIRFPLHIVTLERVLSYS